MHWILIVPYANLHLHAPLLWPPPLPPLCLLPGRRWCQSGRPWGPVRWPLGCDGQQLCVPLPAVWRPLGSRPGAQPAKVTSVQLRKKKKNSYRSRSTSFLLCELDNAANKLTNTSDRNSTCSYIINALNALNIPKERLTCLSKLCY